MRRTTRRFRPTLDVLEARLVPANFTVNTLVDQNDGIGNGQVSLREAIQAANAAPGADTIDFSVLGTIDLNPSLPALTISGQLTIDGPGAANLAVRYVNPATAKRLLEVVASADVHVDGLTFRNGKALTGGAISAVNARLTVTGCEFHNNSSNDDGGAVYFAGRSSNGHTLTLVDCVFANNSSADGGSVWAQPFPNSDVGGPTQVALVNCQFLNSHANTAGALLVAGDQGSSLSLTDCSFVNNSAGNNAGAVGGGFGNNSIGTISNCDFTDNAAGGGGGTALIGMGVGSQLSITDSSFTSNQAGGNGGNLLLTVPRPITIERSTFIDNQSANPIGGVGIGGALWTQGLGGTTTIRDSLFQGNVANQGGAVQTTHAGLIERTTFADNYAKTMGGAVNAASGGMSFINDTFSNNRSDGNGGALLGTSMAINHSTFVGNRADANGDGVGIGGGIVPGPATVMHNTIVAGNLKGVGSVREDIFGSLAAGSSNNLVSVNTNVTGVTNGVNGNKVGTAASPIDPLLGPLANNGGPTPTHALLDNSPAIDAGNNAMVVALTDQRGFLRIADGPDLNAVAVVDIGAYETSLWVSTMPDQETLEDTPVSLAFQGGDTGPGEPTFELSSDNATLLPDAAHLFVTGSGGNYELHMIPAANLSGVAHISLAIHLNGQVKSQTFQLTVHPVNDAPTADAGPDQTVIEGTPVTLTGTFSDVDVGDTHTFHWHVEASNGQVLADGSGQTFDFVPADPGTFTATFTVTDSAGTSASDTAVVTALPVPVTESATFHFEYATWNTKENWGYRTVTVVREGSTAVEMSVDYHAVDESATADVDYRLLPATLVFGVGETSKTFQVKLLDDYVYEGTETLGLVLSHPTNGGSLGTPSTAQVLIADDEVFAPGVVQFKLATATTNEGWGFCTAYVKRTNGSVGTISVDYAIVGGTAQDGSDFTGHTGTLVFGPGETTKSIQIHLTEDSLVEGTESLQILLSNPTGGATLGSPAVMTFHIADNDFAVPGTLQFMYDHFTTNEGWGYAILYVHRSGGSTGTVSVDYSFTSGSAQLGSDVNVAGGTLTFADGETDKQIIVPLIDDSVAEGMEQLFVTLSNPLGGATLGPIATASIDVADND